MFFHKMKWFPISYQLSIIKANTLQFICTPLGQTSWSAWQICTYLNDCHSYQQRFQFQILSGKPFYLQVLLFCVWTKMNWNAAAPEKMNSILYGSGVNILTFRSFFEYFVFIFRLNIWKVYTWGAITKARRQTVE